VYGCLIRYVRSGCALWSAGRWVVQAPRSANIRSVATVLTGTVLAFAVTACNNENISVYRIPKENNQVSMQTGSGNLAPPPPTNPASWTKPASWTEKALSEMRLGSFEVAGANGESADVSITAFPDDAGGLDSNVNRWREQVHQPALESEQLAQSWQEEAVDGAHDHC
jgi:hypothetical protein